MFKPLFLSLGALASITALPAIANDAPPAADWTIGPVIDGRNYSVGMPATPSQGANGQVWFDFPGPTAREGHVHYVTFDPGTLEGAKALRLRLRVDAEAGTRFVPQEAPGRPALLSLYFQRRGDDWRGRGATQYYRWYAPWQTRLTLTAGVHELTVPLDAGWHSVNGKDRADAPREFADAMRQASTVGFTLGSDRGLGHGVFATGRARLTVLEFTLVE